MLVKNVGNSHHREVLFWFSMSKWWWTRAYFYAQGLLLSSEIISVGPREPYVLLGIWPGSAACKRIVLPLQPWWAFSYVSVEHLMSSLEKWIFRSFAHFLILLFFVVKVCDFFVYIEYEFLVRHILCNFVHCSFTMFSP